MRSYSEKRDSEVHLTVESVTSQALELKIRKGKQLEDAGNSNGEPGGGREGSLSFLLWAKPGGGGRGGGRQVQVRCRCLGHSLGSRL